MKKRIVKGDSEHQFFIDFWNFRQCFYYPEEEDAFWEALVDTAQKILEKYKSESFYNYAKRIITITMEEIEERYSEQCIEKKK